MVIDLSAQKGISVDPEKRTARVQPGILLGELDTATQAFELTTPTGNVSMTDVAGLTRGGGLAPVGATRGSKMQLDGRGGRLGGTSVPGS